MTAGRTLQTLALLVLSGCARPAPTIPAPTPAEMPAVPVPAPGTTPAPVRAEDVRRLLTALAHDSLAGRRTGTRGTAMAARIIEAEMRRAGLQPGGDSGFFQRVPIEIDRRMVGRQRMVLLQSLADRDTMPADRIRTDANVIGVLPGADPVLRDEVVIVGAHYDHIGVSRAIDGDSINNGADDDGSGTVATVMIARALAAIAPPKRTIIFIASTGEEVGLLGTRWYIEHPTRPLEQTVADMEIEMIGRPDSLVGGFGRAWLTGFERSTMGESFAAAGLAIGPDPHPAMNFFERSDNIAYARRGIPAHTLSSYNLHEDYHTVNDEVERIDFEHMARVIDAGVAAVRILANGPKPEWKPGGRPLPRR